MFGPLNQVVLLVTKSVSYDIALNSIICSVFLATPYYDLLNVLTKEYVTVPFFTILSLFHWKYGMLNFV